MDKKVEKMLVKMLFKTWNMVGIFLGLESLVNRIYQSNQVLGRDLGLIEDLFGYIRQCVNYILYAYFYKYFKMLKIIEISIVNKMTKVESAINLTEVI